MRESPGNLTAPEASLRDDLPGVYSLLSGK